MLHFIGRVGDFGSVQLKSLMLVERSSHVIHIVSNVEGKLSAEKNNYDLMRARFPAGPVSGAPKIRTATPEGERHRSDKESERIAASDQSPLERQVGPATDEPSRKYARPTAEKQPFHCCLAQSDSS
jgi:hypothetical protein